MILQSFRHKKASNVFKNLQKEAKGIEINEYLYQEVDKISLKGKNISDCYNELVNKISFPQEDYFEFLKKALNIWSKMFS